MSPLLNELEKSVGNQVYIDIELNTLEDAYINIAREEEKLLENLKKHGMQRYTVSKRRNSTLQHEPSEERKDDP